MRIAVIADIHSNIFALDAVLDDIERRGVERIVHLGDAFNGPVDPAGVAHRLREKAMDHVRGNGERMVLAENPAERTRSADYARERLNLEALSWIKSWPMLITRNEYCAFHGTPESDVSYLIEDVSKGGIELRSIADIASDLVGITSRLALCGHSHVPQLVRVHAKLLIVNPGSVGLPAYAEKLPMPHRMEVGSPEARYAIIELGESSVVVAHMSIPYDSNKAAAAATEAGFEAWGRTLLSGYVG